MVPQAARWAHEGRVVEIVTFCPRVPPDAARAIGRLFALTGTWALRASLCELAPHRPA